VRIFEIKKSKHRVALPNGKISAFLDGWLYQQNALEKAYQTSFACESKRDKACGTTANSLE